MPTARPTTHGRPSRRDVLAYGAFAAAGGLVGSSQTGSASTDEAERGSSGSTAIHGLMYPYQFVPGSRVTVRETDLEWRPRGLDSTYRAAVVNYAHAPSFRGFVFADAELPGESRPLALESAPRSSSRSDLLGVRIAPDR